MPAQNAAVRATSSDVVAFSDANSMWEPDALRRLVRHFADPEVGYVCGRLRLIEPGTGAQRRGAVLALRAVAARAGVAARVDHGRQRRDLRGPPQRLRGARARAEPRHRPAVPAAPRRPALALRAGGGGERALRAHDLGGVGAQGPDALALVERRPARRDARPARPASAVLRRADLAPVAALRDRPAARGPAARGARPGDDDAQRAGRGRRARAWLGLALGARRSPGRSRLADFAWYYLVVTAASLAGLARMASQGPQATWSAAEGTR